MIYLLLSILFSIITVSFFKLFEKYNVDTLSAIIANYGCCVLLGNILGENAVITTAFWNEPWFPFTLICGFLFISIFYSIARTTQLMGVSVSMVAAKISVVVPILFAVMLHGEQLTILKVTGIFISLIAVVLISRKDETQVNNLVLWLLPVIVFVGSGFIDTLLNYIENSYIPPADAGSIVTTIFLVAFTIGITVLISRRFIQPKLVAVVPVKFRQQMKNIIWGFILAIPNYFSMFYLVRTLQEFDATYIFPVNNIGIVLGSTLLSILFFGEKLKAVNWIGLLMAVISILIISFA